jgi:hypothetical protein
MLPVLLLGCCAAQVPAAEPTPALSQVLDAIVANERELADTLERYRPLVETYLQTVKPDPVLGSVPVRDGYFLGRLELGRHAAAVDGEREKKKRKKALSLFEEFHSQTFKPEAFARMLVVDRGSFDRDNYQIDFLKSEFLGEVRTLVFDVTPRRGKALDRLKGGRFTGRIWVEDQGYEIVRFNGIYASVMAVNFHFDSWRLELAPGLWLPAFVYTEESAGTFKQVELRHRGQTRLWGYAIEGASAEDEFTRVLVDPATTRDPSEAPGRISPVESARAWESEAEDNVVRRLERAGLLAPQGAVDRILETVVANLEITNSLTIDPPVRCRVLLTTPLESFTVGRTIVVSRGLLDVLPDEASLAAVLAHELGHVLSGHVLDTRFAFTDQVLVGDRQALEQFSFERLPAEEAEADARAFELLERSPYKDDLASAGLFIKALEAQAGSLPSLIRPHFGRQVADPNAPPRTSRLVELAPELEPAAVEQIAALPLGGRVKLDPWNATIELMQNNRPPLLSAREKMPFQVTPLMPHLARQGSPRAPVLAGVEPRQEQPPGAAAAGHGAAVAADRVVHEPE